MNDLISRPAAIDALDRAAECWNIAEPFNEGMRAGYKAAVTIVLSLPSAQPEIAERTAETAQNVSDSDLISRKAAIDAFDGVKVDEENCTEYDIGYNDGIDFAVSRLSVLSSSQPGRKRGKWIAVTEDGDVYKRICSCCGREAFFQNDDPDELYDGGRYELSDFCPHCGADMREVNDGQV